MSFTLEEFIFNTPLYKKIKIEIKDSKELTYLFRSYESRGFDGYNPESKIDTTYSITSDLIDFRTDCFLLRSGFHEIKYCCKRTGLECICSILWNKNSKIIIKFGQLPSLADFHLQEIKQYDDKVILHEKAKEFTRAIGLAANGIGIGSFVYLRRIFEYLIQEAYLRALEAKDISEEDFRGTRMVEKIGLLSHYLPDFLVANKEIYSVLSLGLHELSEQQCLDYFDPLRVGIEIILDERLEEFKKSEKIKKAAKAISTIKTKLGSS